MEGVSTMKQKKLVVHFGAGALGRGLVVPMLYDSGWLPYRACGYKSDADRKNERCKVLYTGCFR